VGFTVLSRSRQESGHMKATAGVGFAACDPATLWTPRLTRKAGLVEETNCPRRGTQDLHFGIPAGWECALPQGIFRSPLRAIALPDRGWGLGAAEQGVGAAGQGEWVLRARGSGCWVLCGDLEF